MIPSEKEWIQDLLKQRYYTENEDSWLDVCERVSTLGRTKTDSKKKSTGIYPVVISYQIAQRCLMQIRVMAICLLVMYCQWKTTLKKSSRLSKIRQLFTSMAGEGTGFDFFTTEARRFSRWKTNQCASGPISFVW